MEAQDWTSYGGGERGPVFHPVYDVGVGRRGFSAAGQE